jgi:pantothenate synthetase
MQLTSTIEEFRKSKAALPGSWGFVPTMGYLHEGIYRCEAGAGRGTAVASIFVVTQFGPMRTWPHPPTSITI